MLILFSNDCPKCRILKDKLIQNGIDFVDSNDLSEIIDKGFKTVPVLKTKDDEYLLFNDALLYLKKYTEGKDDDDVR